MCGILGWLVTEQSEISSQRFQKGINDLFILSETRGKEASGVCTVTDECIQVLKAPLRAKKLIVSDEYKKYIGEVLKCKKRLVMGHARMVTNGSADEAQNNQPVIRGELLCIHNGIIVNSEELWNKHTDLIRNSEVDTEVFLALLEKYNYKDDFFQAFVKAKLEIEGSLSVALLDCNSDWLFLYTNTGSLYIAQSKNRTDVLFSSERYILEEMIKKQSRNVGFQKYRIAKLEPGAACMVNLSDGRVQRFISDKSYIRVQQGKSKRELKCNVLLSYPQKYFHINRPDWERKKVENMLHVDIDRIHAIKRCTKCLLPETFPGIGFDSKGVCSVCNSYQKRTIQGRETFLKEISLNRTLKKGYDCIAPISGGRDSCYILHYLVKELHLKVVAYTYDWGMVTDLARRNIQRMCSALGVEHILISADIAKKRENVRKNVEAWLKHPTLGTIPLFMAGDKQFFYYAQFLKRQMHVSNVIFGMNTLEETRFKARFADLESGRNNDHYYNFSNKNKFRLFTYYGKEFIKNPAYINTSLIDSFTGFLSFYVLPQNYLRFFDYIPWDQKTIEGILIDEYNWETAKDTKETWRIGDGTAPFYNYIYYRLAGFTEFDTFKSNQIREGMLTREEALASIDESNDISADGFLWYCRTIGLDPLRTIRIINQQKPLYEVYRGSV